MSKAQNPVEAFGKAAKVYQEKLMDVSAYHNSLNFYIDHLEPNSNVLELACGPGNLTSYLSSWNKNLNILATDASAEMVELAKQNNPSVNFQILDIKNLAEIKNQFEGIVAGFILNYLSKQEVINFLAPILPRMLFAEDDPNRLSDPISFGRYLNSQFMNITLDLGIRPSDDGFGSLNERYEQERDQLIAEATARHGEDPRPSEDDDEP